MNRRGMAGQRILVDVERLRHPNSGLASFCTSLQRGLLALEAEAELDFYGATQATGPVPRRKFHPWHSVYNPSARGYDLVHVTHQGSTYFARTGLRGQLVATLHDLNFLHESLSPGQIRRRLARARRILERADAIVCISDYVRHDLEANRSLFHLRPRVRLETIHNGLIFELGPVPNLASTFPALAERRILLSIGVLHHKKQQHRLVEMLACLPDDFVLALVYSQARPEYEVRIHEAVSQYGVGGRVHFLPNVSPSEKHALLNGCEALLHPSIAEGFGIPPIEAMAEGKPVFLSQYTSLPEIGGSEAYFFTPGEEAEAMARTVLHGLEDFHSSPGKAERLRQWARHFDYRRMAKAYYALYEDLLTKG